MSQTRMIYRASHLRSSVDHDLRDRRCTRVCGYTLRVDGSATFPLPGESRGARAGSSAQVRFADASDRAAFRAWFVYLADAQFYRTTADVIDCAALVRHAAREALRPHTPDWIRQAALPIVPLVSRRACTAAGQRDAGSRCSASRLVSPRRYAEFADAQTLIRLNARLVSRDVGGGPAWRSAVLPSARAERAASRDGVSSAPRAFEARRTRLGRVPHGTGRG